MQAGVDQARFAISSVGGPGVVITGPTLVENSRSLIGTTTQTDRIVTNTAVNKTFETAVGPGSIKIGDRGLCTATGCSGGTVLVLNFGEYDPTAIASQQIENSESSKWVYDLFGRKVTKPQKGNLYIKNGKKVIY